MGASAPTYKRSVMNNLELIGIFFLTYLSIGMATAYFSKDVIKQVLEEDDEEDFAAEMYLGYVILWPVVVKGLIFDEDSE